MLIEHTFVTTMPAPEAITTTSQLLGLRGFEAVSSGAFAMDQTTWNRLEMNRGSTGGRARYDPTQFPQRILMEWDRGRVTLAAAIEPRVVRRSFAISNASTSLARPKKKQARELAALMTAIVQAVESMLVDRVDQSIALQRWVEVESATQERARRARRRSTIILLSVLGLVICFFGLIIFLALQK